MTGLIWRAALLRAALFAVCGHASQGLRLLLAATAVAFGWGCLGLSAQENPTVPVDRTVTVPLEGLEAIARGDTRRGRAIARDILAVDPKSGLAYLILAAAARADGQSAEATRLAAQSFRFSRPGDQRSQVAYLASQTAFEARRDLTSLYWLRRAHDEAATPERRRAIAEDYARLVAQAEQSLSLSANLAPSTNVNAGSRTSVNTIDGIPAVGLLSPDAQALSGLVLDLGGSYGRRLFQTQSGQGWWRLGLSAHKVVLDQATMTRLGATLPPNLDTAAIETSYLQTQATQFGRAQFGLGLGLALRQANTPLAYGWGSLGFSGRMGPATGYSVFGRAQFIAPTANQVQGDRNLSLGMQIEHRLEGHGVLTLSAQTSGQFREIQGFSSTSYALDASFAPEGRLGAFQLSFEAGVASQHYPGYTIAILTVPGGRRNLTAHGTLVLRHDDLRIWGFSPALRLRHAVSNSNVSRFDSVETSLGLGFVSSF